MALIPYEPFRQLDHMRREMDRLFNWFPFGGGNMMPHIDVYETDTEVVATCDLPGLEKKEDVQIDVSENMLTIRGNINRMQEVQQERMHMQERFVGRFQRTVSLPSPVKEEGVKATYRNGVLEVRMPKAQGETRRRIDVEFH